MVRGLVGDLFSEGIEATVAHAVRETVKAARKALGDMPLDNTGGVTVIAVALRLELDKSAASRRVRAALEAGYLRNLETRPGRPARLVLGDELPTDVELLPTHEALARAAAVARLQVIPGGFTPPLPGESGEPR